MSWEEVSQVLDQAIEQDNEDLLYKAFLLAKFEVENLTHAHDPLAPKVLARIEPYLKGRVTTPGGPFVRLGYVRRRENEL